MSAENQFPPNCTGCYFYFHEGNSCRREEYLEEQGIKLPQSKKISVSQKVERVIVTSPVSNALECTRPLIKEVLVNARRPL